MSARGRSELAQRAIGAAALMLLGVWLGVLLARQVDHPAEAARPQTTALAPQPVADRPAPAPEYDADLMMGHVRRLADDIGPRPAGSPEEARAAEYLLGYLGGLGYHTAETTDIALGEQEGTTRNVVAWTPDAPVSRAGLLIGAHYDSFGVDARSPGANDNASGVAAVLELARLQEDQPAPCPIYFAAFGGEERVDEDADHHHFGSRHFFAHQPRPLVAMISVDMVGVGERLFLRYLEPAPEPLLEMLEDAASAVGIAVQRRPDEGWSDHEPFARGGIPAVWLQRREDPNQHTEADRSDQIEPVYLQSTVGLLAQMLSELTPEHLDALAGWSAGWTPTGTAEGEG